MSTVVSLAEHRRRRTARRAGRAVFCFDLAHPGTYLAAERVERLPAAVHWQPAIAPSLVAADREAYEERAFALRLPLVWPDRGVAPVRRAQRAAALAADQGRGAPFVLAATRLAFCGGFDLDDPEVLAEAAAAAGVDLDPCLAAASDPARDEAIDRAGRFLVAHGADAMPVLQVGHTLFAGEGRTSEAAAALRDPRAHGARARARD